MRALIATLLLVGLSSTAALADPPPAQDAKPLSELLQSVEKGADFGYFDEVEWENGSYEVEFYTKTGTKKKIYIDAVSGNHRP
jgi:uncharacterized membrane protein YkoI